MRYKANLIIMSTLEELRRKNGKNKLQFQTWKSFSSKDKMGIFLKDNFSLLQFFDSSDINCFEFNIPISQLCPFSYTACCGNTSLLLDFVDHMKNHICQEILQEALDETLCLIIRLHNLEIIKFFVGLGSSVNAVSSHYKESVLASICGDYYVSEDDCLAIVKYLVEKGANDLDRALSCAAYTYRVEVLKYLLSKGANPNGRITGPLTRAGFNDQYKVPKILLENGANPNYNIGFGGSTALLWASFHEAENTVKLLFHYGADPDRVCTFSLSSNTSLHVACLRGNITIVALHIKAFCNVNLLGRMIRSRDLPKGNNLPERYNGKDALFTPLESLCFSYPFEKKKDIISILVAAGASISSELSRVDVSAFGSSESKLTIDELCCTPATLLHICRCTIRKELKGRKETFIKENLKLPSYLVSYILMEKELLPYISHLVKFEN